MNINLKDAKILIVDDEPANIEILEDLLTLNGYLKVKSITDSRKVQDTINTDKPDLLLLDLMMPHVNGFQIMEILKAKGLIDGFMPIMVLTADITTETKQNALSAGASDFLTKPFDLTEVSLRIRNLLFTVYLLIQQRDYNIILEERVKERTAELRQLNSELIKAKEKAEENNKLKTFFLANISHEFRTPLISILGFSQILSDELDSNDHKEYARLINDSGSRLEKTLNDLIFLTDIESKKIGATFSKTDLIEYVKVLSDEFKHKIENNGLKYETNFEEPHLELYTDKELLKYVLDNVIDNSIKYTKKGSVKIEVFKDIDDGQSIVIIKVSDTGIGIDPESQKKIFQPFRQGSEGYSRKYDGMGIGLTVCKQFLEILRGKIDISSIPGMGTDVFIKLPAVNTEDELKEKIKIKKQEIVELVTSVATRKPHLLLVEDNLGNRVLYQKILQDDFDVVMAIDGISAIAMTEVNTYDIILMDINLGPGIDGIETFKRIKKFSNYKDVPIVAVTAFGAMDDRAKFINYGFADYIQKPVLKEEFIALIYNHTKKN